MLSDKTNSVEEYRFKRFDSDDRRRVEEVVKNLKYEAHKRRANSVKPTRRTK